MGTLNKYCVCTMPDVWPSYKDNFDSRFDLIADVTNQPFESGFTFTERDIREKLGFAGEVSKRSWWNSYGNRTIAWYYAHFRMLLYYLENPNYDFYYFLDDDVKVNDWDDLFRGLYLDKSDFIAYFVFKNKGVKSQDVPEIDNRTYSGVEWFKRYPADGDTFSSEELFGSFFPIVRFSNKAMEELVNACKSGLFGYGEGFVPTYLNWKGYSLKSLINADNTSDFFDVDRVNVLHKNQKINWEWI